jgi:transposase
VEWKELESILTINRMGIVDARRKKIALHIEEKLDALPLDMMNLDARLIPRMLSILTLTYNISATYHVIHELPSEAVVFHKIHNKMQNVNDNLMDVEYS